MAYIASRDLVPGVLKGEPRAVARMLTRAETGTAEAREALDEIFRRAGRAHVVGITGVPGSGKSTLVAKLAAVVRASGRRIGIVAVDPSSPFSGGSILGDRIRMADLAGDPGVYVRSMATRGALGGLASGTLESVDVLDAAGYDMVMIETVGVGQDEVEVARAAHTTVVVSAPGLGDDIQAIKAGILEIADVHVVSKCDKPDANKTIAELKAMLTLGLSLKRGDEPGSRWPVPVVATSSLREEGVAELLAAIDGHHRHLLASGEIAARRAAINERRMLRAGEEILRAAFARHRDARVAPLLEALSARTLSPHVAARRLLAELHMGDKA
ncbi:MAG TPA: methylmalonyl Co-A mutase-associated GTPase MeaB [Casimicrobiaceae bacterium]|nr:methylmalonyl Co-A mutase-associated GTPase MeaB [Casimicrobiaceae bacterium]